MSDTESPIYLHGNVFLEFPPHIQARVDAIVEAARAAERERIAKHLEKQSAEYMANATNNRFLTDHGRAIMTSASDWAETTAAAIRALK